MVEPGPLPSVLEDSHHLRQLALIWRWFAAKALHKNHNICQQARRTRARCMEVSCESAMLYYRCQSTLSNGEQKQEPSSGRRSA